MSKNFTACNAAKSDPSNPAALHYLLGQMQLALGFDWKIGDAADTQLNRAVSYEAAMFGLNGMIHACLDIWGGMPVLPV